MIKDIFSADELSGFYHQTFWDIRKKLNRRDFEKSGCVIYGAGNQGRLVASSLRDAGIKPICFIDQNPLLCGKKIDGMMVCQPSELDNYASSYIVISSCHIRSILTNNKFLMDKKVVLWSALSDFCSVLPILPDKPEDILENTETEEVYYLLEDEISRKIFHDFIKFQLNFSEELFHGEKSNGYFPNDINLNYKVFIDAGAADGDTLRSWLKVVKTLLKKELYYYAFEPNLFLFHKMSTYVSTIEDKIKSKIKLYNLAIGENDTLCKISNIGKSSSIEGNINKNSHQDTDKNSDIIRIMRLDSLSLKRTPTFIKADIEGSEMSLLKGSKNTIHSIGSDLAISVYHKYDDIWKVPLLIKQINKNYRFYLRHATQSLDDVILFATCKRDEK